jgi:hypothetical protein
MGNTEHLLFLTLEPEMHCSHLHSAWEAGGFPFLPQMIRRAGGSSWPVYDLFLPGTLQQWQRQEVVVTERIPCNLQFTHFTDPGPENVPAFVTNSIGNRERIKVLIR